MDLGTPPEPGGEVLGSLIKNELHKKISADRHNIFIR
jgi:hypothetical protein